MTITVTSLTGLSILAAVPAVARLRVEVFREWPYLYDGTFEYESGYLAHYTRTPRAIVVAALEGETIVGAATAMPLADAAAPFSQPFRDRGDDIGSIFYFGESVLLPAYRGRGIGHAFFDHREAHARSFGVYSQAVFCAVERPPEDPRRPAGHRTLDAFWQKRGYARLEGVRTAFSWKEVGVDGESRKPMQYWGRSL